MEANPFLVLSEDKPVWATTSKNMNYAMLVDTLDKIGSTKAVVMSLDQFKKAFPHKGARSNIKAFAKSKGWKVLIVLHENKVAITGTKLDRPIYIKKEDGTVRVA